MEGLPVNISKGLHIKYTVVGKKIHQNRLIFWFDIIVLECTEAILPQTKIFHKSLLVEVWYQQNMTVTRQKRKDETLSKSWIYIELGLRVCHSDSSSQQTFAPKCLVCNTTLFITNDNSILVIWVRSLIPENGAQQLEDVQATSPSPSRSFMYVN